MKIANTIIDIPTIIVIVILLLFVIDGWRRGLFRKVTGVLAFVLSCVLVPLVLPYVTDIIKEKTPVYEFIVDRCEETIGKQLVSFAGQKGNGKKGIDRDEIRSLMEQHGMDTSQLDWLSDAELESLANQYFADYLAQNGGVSGSLSSLSKIDQTKLIQSLPLPGFLQNMMLSYNNREGYRALAATNFGEYLVRFVANVILNILAFLATLIVVYIVVWIVLKIIGIASHLPGLRFLDRIGGMILGGVQGIIFIWFLFMVISLLSGTDFGLTVSEAISNSKFLQPLYDNNALMKIVTDALRGMM